ncbi:MAG: CoA-transferase, partial [bacterium]|nr:CoA-transferase [bacterium]
MKNKVVSYKKALEGLQDGMSIMIGGFLGVGAPEGLVDRVIQMGVTDLTVIGN